MGHVDSPLLFPPSLFPILLLAYPWPDPWLVSVKYICAALTYSSLSALYAGIALLDYFERL